MATIAWSRNTRGVAGVGFIEEPATLFGREPISESNTDSPHALHSSDSRR
jgi:hypothetical protein